MIKLFAACLVAGAFLADVKAADPEDGIYSCAYEGTGAKVRRTDGGEVILGKRLGSVSGAASIRSVRNDNSFFSMDLKNVGPLAEDRAMPYHLVVVDGLYIAVVGHTDRGPDGTQDFSCQVAGAAAADKVAARLKTIVQRRSHPGHRFEVRWTPERETYHPGEAVTIVLTIRNTGTVPFAFQVGGQQRGARDNQYRFLAYRSSGYGKAVPDTGDPNHHGGISYNQVLKPGEVFTAKVDLSKWFTFTDADTYRITGLFELQLYEPDRGIGSQPTWDDLAVGDCFVRVVAKEK
jgi:hypothetical protein